MRKLKLLFATLALLVTGVVAVNAEGASSTPSWTSSSLGEGTFYLYNVGADKFLCSGNNWGSHASLTEGGLPVVFAGSDNEYTFSTAIVYTGKYLNGEWADGSSMVWTFEGLASNQFKIKNGTNYLFWEGGTSTRVVAGEDPGTDNAVWMLVTEENRIADLANATATNPIDATFLIKNAYFAKGNGGVTGSARKNRLAPCWSGTNMTDIWGLDVGEPTACFAVEQYGKQFDNYQELTVPNGVYQMTAKGFYRGTVIPYIYANDQKCNLKVKGELRNNSGDVVDNIESAAIALRGDDYLLDGVTVTVTDGQLRVGVKSDEQIEWCAFDDFQLTYLGPAATTDYTITVSLTHPSSMTELPSVGVTGTGVTQNGENSYKAPAGTAITVTPEAVDGYTVTVTVAEDNDVTQGEGQSITPTQSNGTWSFTSTERNITVTVTYEEIPTYSINNLKYGSQVTIGEVSTTIGDVSTITGVNAGELVTIDVSDIAVSPGMSWIIHANTAVGALTEEALSHVGDVWTFTMPEGDAYVYFSEEYVYSTFTLNVTEGEGMTEAPDVSYSPQFTSAGKVRSGSNVTINIPAYAGYDATATYQAASDAEPTTLTISNNKAQITMPAEDVTATVVYTKHEYTITGLPATNTTFTIGGTLYESGDVTATEGTIITVSPDLNYKITAFTATYVPATGGDPIGLTIDAVGGAKSFSMPPGDVTVTCTAEEITIDPDAIPVTVPALSFVTYVDAGNSLALATGSTAQLYGVSDVTATEVQLTSQLTEVPMGHHFLIYNPTEADIIAQLMVTNLAGSMEGVGSGWDFIDPTGSTIDPDDYDGSSIYLCGGKQFLKAIGAGKLAEHRWMLQVADETEGGDQPKARAIVFNNATRIGSIDNGKLKIENWYDLNGRKLSAKPTKKGVYIKDGMKAVIK